MRRKAVFDRHTRKKKQNEKYSHQEVCRAGTTNFMKRNVFKKTKLEGGKA